MSTYYLCNERPLEAYTNVDDLLITIILYLNIIIPTPAAL